MPTITQYQTLLRNNLMLRFLQYMYPNYCLESFFLILWLFPILNNNIYIAVLTLWMFCIALFFNTIFNLENNSRCLNNLTVRTSDFNNAILYNYSPNVRQDFMESIVRCVARQDGSLYRVYSFFLSRIDLKYL